jgi:type IV pilus assembly protein PilB
MAKLDIAERRIPQDGRFSLTLAKQSVRDCRISTCPTLFGEKVVVRILNPSDMTLEIAQLGMNAEQQKKFLECVNAPQGMVLVTGPTGSGKTVTLYTALQLLNTEDQNISTAEDPVEINLLGINQVEVNHKIGLDFALALRTFLRQDPDVIMVGEIRDLETAQIAIKAAQTGHLVLSTLHTNSAAESITRLINIGIPAFNIISSVKLIIAQRLLRKLCPHCKKLVNLPSEILYEYNIDADKFKNAIFYQAGECKRCKNGYRGRIGIFELMPISKGIAQMIMQQNSAMEIEQQAKREGMISLREAALQLVLAGETTLEEINRVVL